MREYPSIRQSRKPFKAHVFDKLDGSNLPISWDIKQGWYELATRTRTISTEHNLYSKGYQYFLEVYAQEIEKITNQSNWKRLDAFFEFHGDNSFAGRHDLQRFSNEWTTVCNSAQITINFICSNVGVYSTENCCKRNSTPYLH